MNASILIVDDEPLIAFEIETTLSDAGFTDLHIRGTITDALRHIEAHRLDAAVIDANLANESAEPLAQALRARQVPFVILSGYSSDQIGPWSEGVPTMRKPFRSEDLVEGVKRLLAAAS